MSDIKVTVTFKREETVDESPDLSYLEMSHDDVLNPTERAKYRRQDLVRLAAYRNGDWYMVAIRAVATIWIQRAGYQTNYTLKSPGLWGIESDSEESYLESVYKEECSVLQADIEAMKAAEFKL